MDTINKNIIKSVFYTAFLVLIIYLIYQLVDLTKLIDDEYSDLNSKLTGYLSFAVALDYIVVIFSFIMSTGAFVLSFFKNETVRGYYYKLITLLSIFFLVSLIFYVVLKIELPNLIERLMKQMINDAENVNFDNVSESVNSAMDFYSLAKALVFEPMLDVLFVASINILIALISVFIIDIKVNNDAIQGFIKLQTDSCDNSNNNINIDLNDSNDNIEITT